MIVIGVDSHKRSHTAVAVDGTGRKLAEKTLAATSAGHLELVRWAARFADRTWALEDCRHSPVGCRTTSSSAASG